ncbi:MAG: DapH/DapD/GlmU-related protein [Promethearchaeota archaeon]
MKHTSIEKINDSVIIAKTALIMDNVQLGKNSTIQDYVIIGVLPLNTDKTPIKTIIGDNAFIRSHTVIYAGTLIGKNLTTGHHVNIREYNKIGNNVSIGTKTVIEFKTKIGNNVRIHSQVFIPEFCVIEDDCWIGPNVVLTNSKYPYSERSKEFLQGVTIKRGAKIGANSTILPGVNIGENSLIGAGSVVTKDVPSNSVVAGNPAKIIKDVHDLTYPDKTPVY